MKPVDPIKLLNAKTFREEGTALHMATRLEQSELVRLSIRSGAIYNVTNAMHAPADLAEGDLKIYFTRVGNLFELTAAEDIQQVLEILAQEPSVINERDENGGEAALHLALQ